VCDYTDAFLAKSRWSDQAHYRIVGERPVPYKPMYLQLDGEAPYVYADEADGYFGAGCDHDLMYVFGRWEPSANSPMARAATRIQAAFRGWRFRKHVLCNPDTDVGARRLQQRAQSVGSWDSVSLASTPLVTAEAATRKRTKRGMGTEKRMRA
jgi:hypothetical protein